MATRREPETPRELSRRGLEHLIYGGPGRPRCLTVEEYRHGHDVDGETEFASRESAYFTITEMFWAWEQIRVKVLAWWKRRKITGLPFVEVLRQKQTGSGGFQASVPHDGPMVPRGGIVKRCLPGSSTCWAGCGPVDLDALAKLLDIPEEKPVVCPPCPCGDPTCGADVD